MGLREIGELTRVTAAFVTTDISARWSRNLTLGGRLASEICAEKTRTLKSEGCGTRLQ
jgi:hypothetical protein